MIATNQDKPHYVVMPDEPSEEMRTFLTHSYELDLQPYKVVRSEEVREWLVYRRLPYEERVQGGPVAELCAKFDSASEAYAHMYDLRAKWLYARLKALGAKELISKPVEVSDNVFLIALLRAMREQVKWFDERYEKLLERWKKLHGFGSDKEA